VGYSHLGHDSVLQTTAITSVCKAIEATTKQRSRKRKCIQTKENSTADMVLDLIAEKQRGGEEVAKQSAGRARAEALRAL
jgi:hypothetical protein